LWHGFSKSDLYKFKNRLKKEIVMVKVIEVIGASDKGFTEATQAAVTEAAKSVKNIKSIFIKYMNANVENDQIVSYAVNAKISFEIEK
jgi:dodecin